MEKNIMIRVDSGHIIGMGHLSRCLCLIKRIEDYCTKRKIFLNVIFVCGNHKNNGIKVIPERYNIKLLNITESLTTDWTTWLGLAIEDDLLESLKVIRDNKIDIVIVDHYSIDWHWESNIKNKVDKLIVIDDLRNRSHECDILIDHNHYFDENIYSDLVPTYCTRYVGCEYLLINDNFINTKSRDRDIVRRVHICMGGSDHMNVTGMILTTLIKYYKSIHNYENIIFDVVLGHSNMHYDDILQLLDGSSHRSQYNLYHGVDNMPQLLERADLCIGSSGISSYERICMGVPSIVITTSNDQLNVATTLSKLHLIKYIGHYDKVDNNHIINSLNNYIMDGLTYDSKLIKSFTNFNKFQDLLNDIVS